ncbi:cupin [Actinocorallia longicatena]|uniref:Cupin n=1 Tax=Actinocorallia longicatena TaxID=111803 RepID=A0ABP6QC10_9ACTN
MEDLTATTRTCLEKARSDAHGRGAHLFLTQGPLRQTVIALTAGSRLEDHNAPPAASLQVLTGRVLLTASSGDQELTTAQIHPIPQERHGLTALEDSAVLLTTVTNLNP